MRADSVLPGSVLHSMGPIGHGFSLSDTRPIMLPPGGGVGIPPVLFQAQRLWLELIQEHLTTREANARLRERRSTGEIGRRVRRAEVDSLAACLIARDRQETQA